MRNRGKLKYNNHKVEFDGHKFDSQKEMNRYIELSNDATVSDLRCQVKYELIPSQKVDGKVLHRAIDYKADFVYKKDNKEIVEDVKSPITLKDKVFKLKQKLFYYRYGFDISIYL